MPSPPDTAAGETSAEVKPKQVRYARVPYSHWFSEELAAALGRRTPCVCRVVLLGEQQFRHSKAITGDAHKGDMPV